MPPPACVRLSCRLSTVQQPPRRLRRGSGSPADRLRPERRLCCGFVAQHPPRVLRLSLALAHPLGLTRHDPASRWCTPHPRRLSTRRAHGSTTRAFLRSIPGCCSVGGCCSPVCVYSLCDPFPNNKRIKKATCPVLCMHGTHDNVVVRSARSPADAHSARAAEQRRHCGASPDLARRIARTRTSCTNAARPSAAARLTSSAVLATTTSSNTTQARASLPARRARRHLRSAQSSPRSYWRVGRVGCACESSVTGCVRSALCAAEAYYATLSAFIKSLGDEGAAEARGPRGTGGADAVTGHVRPSSVNPDVGQPRELTCAREGGAFGLQRKAPSA